MYLWCVIGDPHAQTKNLSSLKTIFDFVQTKDVKYLVLLGDLFHTHSTIKAEIMHFWEEAIYSLSQKCTVFILKGNHDGPHDRANFFNMGPLNTLSKISFPNTYFVLKPLLIEIDSKNVLFMPYYFDKDKFLQDIEHVLGDSKADIIFCHQTFNGASYENGFYAPDGFSIEKLKTFLSDGGKIISGHIHLRQTIDIVDYVGSPLWLTQSDANTSKYLLFIDHNWQYEWFDISNLLPPLYALEIKGINDLRAFLENHKNKDLSNTILNIYAAEDEIAQCKSLVEKTSINYRIVPIYNKPKNLESLDIKKMTLEEWIFKRVKTQRRDKVLQILHSLKTSP